MAKTYTQHKLTDAQLRRLSAIINHTPRTAYAGTAGDALIRKGLVAYDDRPERNSFMPLATDSGVEALARARKEGW